MEAFVRLSSQTSWMKAKNPCNLNVNCKNAHHASLELRSTITGPPYFSGVYVNSSSAYLNIVGSS